MPKRSGLTNRNVVNHQNGKGSKTRVTDVQAYRRNFDDIDWRTGDSVKRRTLAELRDDYEFRHGL